MTTAIVLVKIASGKDKQVLEKLRLIEGVTHITAVFGRWDLVVDVEAKDLQELSWIVIAKIRKIKGVENTETLITTSI
ncbi:MAG: Lrp/AsnC ligand binding domain-containing protein [Endomicrobia bacterium]|nr:Lrp/AsnC ligand binding domain-containing protein [Endomicrobiia bacterium]MCX7941231.1 Lrp/AsnC ligand binding domain-containing protein [Endomicrobiia bacterium]MDW8056075.1 Lrp/AsnC ligand binding domain-containing protein [Elusimicrobiota bacterium]